MTSAIANLTPYGSLIQLLILNLRRSCIKLPIRQLMKMKKNIELTIVLKIKTKEEYKYNFVNFNIYKN